MMKKMLSALAASALMAASPAIAQSAAPLAVTPAAADASEFEGASALDGEYGLSFYLLAAVAVALVAWGVYELIDKEESESP